MGHVHFKLVVRQQLGVAVGSLAAGEPAREKLFILAMEATVPRERREKRGRRGEEGEERKEEGGGGRREEEEGGRRRKEGGGGRREEEERGERTEEGGRRRRQGGGERREKERKGEMREKRRKEKHWLEISVHVMRRTPYFLLTTVQSCVKDLTQSRTRRSSERLASRERKGGRKSHCKSLHQIEQTCRALTWQVLAREFPGFGASVGGW